MQYDGALTREIRAYSDAAISYGKKLLKPAAKIITAAIVKKLANMSLDEITSLASDEEKKESADGKYDLEKLTEVALENHLGRKEAIKSFKDKIGKLVDVLSEEDKPLPLFVFVDELDRCRPNYAIELLEAIKHLFSIPGIYFVIATNLDQLAHSVAVLYGERFESERYLQRFFDQEYTLPNPNNWRFARFLFEKNEFDKIPNVYSVITGGVYQNTHQVTDNQALFALFSEAFSFGLRDQEYAANTLQTVLLNWPNNESVHLAYLLFLIFVRRTSSPLFQHIVEQKPLLHGTFMSGLNECMNPQVSFLMAGHRAYIEHSLITLINEYYIAQKIPLKEIYMNTETALGSIYIQLTNDVRSLPPKTELHPIAEYPMRVSQAGQLSTPGSL